MKEVFVDLASLDDHVSEYDKTGSLLQSLSDSFGFISLMEEATNMNYDSSCALHSSEMKQQKARNRSGLLEVHTPAAKMADRK